MVALAITCLAAAPACSSGPEPEPDGDSQDGEISEATTTGRGQLTSSAIDFGGHEPGVQVFTKVFRAFEPRSFPLQNLSRPISVELAWWANGTPYPSLFRLTGTFPNGASYSTPLGTNPLLELPYLPGQTSAQIDIEHQSQSPEFRAKMVMRWPVVESELGTCGPAARDLFVRWVRGNKNWETNYQIAEVAELTPGALSVLTCGGLCYQNVYTLRGVLPALPGAVGPILQVEDRQDNPYQSSVSFYSLLFYDQAGALLRTVKGRIISVLPDGNLFISTALGNPTAWNVQEAVAAITPTGTTAWARNIGGSIPGASIVTAGGNIAMPWKFDNTAGVPVFDPRTGAEVGETIIDRSPLCTPASTSPACTSLRAEAEARLDDWWLWNWNAYGYWDNGPRSVCDSNFYSCSTASLGGWMMFGNELVLEIDVAHEDLLMRKMTYHKRLGFHGIGDPTPHATVAGAFYRRLGNDRLLVSEAYASFATATERELVGEGWRAVGARGVTAWRRGLGGSPALTNVRNSSFGSVGVPLPGNRVLWSAYSFMNGSSSFQTTTVDLATGLIVSTKVPVRALEGVCRPF